MKVLWIGHFLQTGGWSEATKNYILAMDSVGIDIIPRPFPLNSPQIQPEGRLKQLMEKSSIGCDICIQHLLPHYMQYDGHFKKNIGLFVLESHNIKYTPWPSYLNLMDELWVPCQYMIDNKDNNGIKVPMELVPHAFDLTKYKEYSPLDIPELTGNYVFYYIGELTRRKNLEALITAFQIAFRSNKAVALILKISLPGVDYQNLNNMVKGLCNKIKKSLRLYINEHLYKDETIITQYLSEEDLIKLHKSCHCYISTSHGEGFCLPAMEALMLGNLVIAPNCTAFQDFVHPDFLVDCQESPCVDMFETFDGHNTSNEVWYDINVVNLMKKMRFCYENRDMTKYKKWYQNKVQEFSYATIGNKIKNLLKQ